MSRFDLPASDDERDGHHAMVRRTCRDCLGDVYVGRDEPWVLHVLCDRCIERVVAQGTDTRRQGAA